MGFTKPSKNYTAELRQVADFADDLYGFLADQPNMLPIGFPSDAVITLCSALRQLPDGSVEGSVPILEAGLEQCPTIRRNYIPVEVEPTDPDYDPDAPPVYRGGELDVLINDLYVAIGTAIDAFKDEYGPGFRDGIEIDTPVQAQPEFVLDAAINNARSAEIQIAGFRADNSDILEDEGELLRGLIDTDSELKVARSTASMPAPKPNLLSRLGEYLSKAPEALRTVGRSARAFADISSPVAESAAKIFVSSWQATLDAIAIAGEGIEESGRRMAAWRDRKWQEENPPAEPEISTDPKYDERQANELILSGKELPESWYPKVRNIRLAQKAKKKWLDPQASARVISRLTNLQYAELNTSPFTEFSFLNGCEDLVELRISNTFIETLRWIDEFPKMRVLHLNGCQQLDNLHGIERLKNLNAIQIRVPQKLDFSPLFFLGRLESLIVNPETIDSGDLSELQAALPNLLVNTRKPRNRRRRRGPKS